MTAIQPPLTPRRRRARVALFVVMGVVVVLAAVAAVCEQQGWPFLAGPTERWFSQRLGRGIHLREAASSDPAMPFALHLWGGVRVQSPWLQIDGPSWRAQPPTLTARDVNLHLRYADLLAARSSRTLAVAEVSAAQLDLNLLRREDGSASWQFGAQADGDLPQPIHVEPQMLVVGKGRVVVDDALNQLQLDSRFALTDHGLVASAEGRHQGLPVKASLSSDSVMPWISAVADGPGSAVALRLSVGRASLSFDGRANDLMGSQQLAGQYRVTGPSLADVGRPLRLTLPTTRAFAMQGRLAHHAQTWSTVVDTASIGRSRLSGEFTFNAPPHAVTTLAGRLHGQVVWLEDLGPAIGVPTTPDIGVPIPPVPAKALPTDALPANEVRAPAVQAKAVGSAAVRATSVPATATRVLPVRRFDLQALRKMNANVLIDVHRLETGWPRVQAIAPLHTHLTLADGVLSFNDLDASLAQGRLQGRLILDGRTEPAPWQTHLSATGLRLEQWIAQPRANGAPPYASGLLQARIDLQGVGYSTAQMLASADGRMLVNWSQGKVSELALEVIGLDIAQALGVMLRGDQALPVNCGGADLVVKQGRIEPRVMLIDTAESTIWVDGSMSLANEQLALVAHVAPKDFSLLSLRTPVHIDGTLASPKVSFEKPPMLRRLVPAVLLAAVVPVAALVPLADSGDANMTAAIASCMALAKRNSAPAKAVTTNPSPSRR